MIGARMADKKRYCILHAFLLLSLYLEHNDFYNPQFSVYKHCAVMEPSPLVSISLKIYSSPLVSCLLSLAPIVFEFMNRNFNKSLANYD